MLEISNLHADVAGTNILKGVELTINAGEVHAIMGPNGSGKSTLSNVVAGRPGYTVTKGDVRLNGQSILDMEVEERAQAGVFLAFQYPVEIPGVSNMEFLKASVDSLAAARGDEPLSAAAFMKRIREIAGELSLDTDFLKRGVNEGFSGGEKKRNEILQLLALEPSLALLDETDSGLDIDALQVVSRGVNSFLREDRAVLMITHYQRLLDYIKPDFVHVLSGGQIIRSGDASLALELEAKGYGWLTQ
ncbi:MAG: Fe-S cluster assembly ATPase SufC [Pseudomonadaceae bacterium]|nr:Fe-S cluster assembly ATPase SufC [Pseudomonadaceae bacterium]